MNELTTFRDGKRRQFGAPRGQMCRRASGGQLDRSLRAFCGGKRREFRSAGRQTFPVDGRGTAGVVYLLFAAGKRWASESSSANVTLGSAGGQ